MKLPLQVAESKGCDGRIRIADAHHQIVCKMEIEDGRELAELIVARINGGLLSILRRRFVAWKGLR